MADGKAGQQPGEFPKLAGRLIGLFGGGYHVNGIAAGGEGHETEVAFRRLNEAPAVLCAERLDEKIFRVMSLQVERHGVHILCDEMVMMKYGVIDTLKDIRFRSMGYFP